MKRICLKTSVKAGFGSVLVLATCSAQAHHPLDGLVPSTMVEGLVSGLAHPILGLDHFAFIISIGLVAALQSSPLLRSTGVFIVTSLAGTLLYLSGAMLPGAESLIAFSVVLSGLSISGYLQNRNAVLALLSLAGTCHGLAYGEGIAGATQDVVLAYLAGLVAVQTILAALALYLCRIVIRQYQFKPAGLGKGLGSIVSASGLLLMLSAMA